MFKLFLLSCFCLLLSQNVDAKSADIDSLLQQGELEFKNGDYAKSLKINYKALKLAEKINDCPKILTAKYKVARNYHALDNRKVAMPIYYEIAQKAKACQIDSMQRKAYYYIAALHTFYKQADSAEYYLKKTEHFMQNAPLAETARFYGVFSAFCLEQKQDLALGEKYARKGIEAAEKSNDLIAKAFAQIRLGACYKGNGNYESAIKCFKKGLKLYENANYVSGQVFALNVITKTLHNLNNYKGAYETYQKLKILEDSIYTAKSATEIANYQTLYETEKKEADLKETSLKLKNQKQRTLYISILAFAVLFIGILAVAFWYFRSQTQKRLELIQMKEKERNRIARELHDNVGSTVSFIVSKLDSVIYNADNQRDKTELTKVKKTAQEVMLNLRETLWTLNNPNISNVELADKLKSYIKKYSLIPTKIIDKINTELQLPNEAVLAIYRSVQEIINNANKHSQATQINIEFNDKNAAFFVKIEDNGIGFIEKEKAESYGLRNIRSRLTEIGAELHLESNPNVGTIIEITYV